MHLEYYTFTQAGRVLGCEADEVEHLVETFKLPVYVYAKRDQFIITKDRYGRALVTYRGLFPLSDKHVLTLYSDFHLFIEDEIKLSSLGIVAWEKSLPVDPDIYIREVPLDLEGWIATSKKDFENETEFTALLYCSIYAENIQETHRQERDEELRLNGFTNLDHYKYVSFQEYGKGDLRILHDDLVQFEESLSRHQKPKELDLVTPQINLSGMKGIKSRKNGLHDLILKILAKDIDKSALEVWRTIERDLRKKVREVDVDEIVIEMYDKTLTWISPYGHEQKQKFSSFESTVSRKKKELRAHLAQQ